MRVNIYEELKKETTLLTDWIQKLMDEADTTKDTKNKWYNYNSEFEAVEFMPYFIVAGWSAEYPEGLSDLFFMKDGKALGLKVVPNLTYEHAFDTLNMPVDKSGEVEDISVMIERDDDAAALADFFLAELERLIKEYHA